MKSILSLSFVILFTLSLNAQVGIGTTMPQAALDIVSTTDGLLIPRVSLTSEVLSAPVITPAEGELVFNTNTIGTLTPGFYYWLATGGPWVRIGDTVTPPPPPPSFGAWLLGGNLAGSGDALGTNNNVDLIFKRGTITSGRIGTSNTSFGRSAGALNVGTENTYIGVNAGAFLAQGATSNNVAIGWQAMQGTPGTNASQSVVIGSQALQTPGTNASNNIAIGFRAGISTSGSNSIMIGADTVIAAAQGSIAIGAGARSEFTGSIAFGVGATATATDQITLGNAGITELRCNTSVITGLSDRRDKDDIVELSEGIEFIKQLNPVTYTWNARDKSKVGAKAVGFIAQDLLKLQQESAIGENLDLVNYNNPDKLEARYGNLLPVMVKGIQEQQKQIETLKKQNLELIKMNATILKRLEALEAGEVAEVTAEVSEKK